ncbi:MAG TPA: hypothetical protein PLP19_09600 [bacterium]|nr:hypothetical protein [bacterium]HPN43731.1 hypothetical protein [bacterium]
MHKTSEKFRERYANLPHDIQELADKNFQLLKNDPRNPSLHFKKIGDLWSVRIGLTYRVLAVQDGDDFIWVWIGSHDDYEKIIREC